MAHLNPILIVVIAAASVLLTLPAMFIFLAWQTHRQQMSWKEEHDRAVESIDQERRRSREARMAPSSSPPPPPPPHTTTPRNTNENKDKKKRQPPMKQQQQQQKPKKEGETRNNTVQRRPSTLPPRPATQYAHKQHKSRGSRDTAPPQAEGFQVEGVLPGWGQRVRGASPRIGTRAVDGE